MLNKILKGSFYLLLCITPFLFTKFNSELFEFNKMIFVYAMTVIITGVWILRMISAKELIFKKTPLDIPIGLFLLSQILSTFFSIDFHTSIWGYYSRSNGGLLSIISYIVLYYAFVSNFTKYDVIRFLRASAIAGFFVALYAIPEHFGLSPSCIILTGEYTASCWVQDVQARVFGTLGQPNWLAAYLEMLIFPAIYFFISAKNFRNRIIYLVISSAYFLAFTFTYSRGATLGLISGLVILTLGVLIYSKKVNSFYTFKNSLAMLVVFGMLTVLFGSALTEFRLIKNPAVPTRPGIPQGQAAPSGTQLENGGTESGQIRLIVWRGALDIFKAYPLFGSGVETFAYSYYQFRPNEHNLVSEWDFLYNKAHNEYLNYLSTTGIFGFLSYILMIIVFTLASVKIFFAGLKHKNPDESYLLLPAIGAGYAAYLIQNFFLFSVVAVALFFYLFPAFVFVFFEKTGTLGKGNLIALYLKNLFELIGRKNLARKLIQVLVVAIVLLILNTIISLWEADTNYKKGSDYNDAGNPGRAYNFLIDAVRLNSSEPLYLAELGNAAGSSSLALLNEDPTTSAQLKDDAVFFTDLGILISPMNTTVLRTAIRTYFQLALMDPSYKQKTLEVVDKSIALAPTDPKILLNKQVILTQFEMNDEAIAVLKKAIELKPNYREARLNLANLYIKKGEKELAKEHIDYILTLIPGDPDALKLELQLQ
jgi:putative inorganic carbon (hco3(-)) transporter